VCFVVLVVWRWGILGGELLCVGILVVILGVYFRCYFEHISAYLASAEKALFWFFPFFHLRFVFCCFFT